MIKRTESINPSIETDDERYKELVELYNKWDAETCFCSHCSWLDSNETWKKMHKYCEEHPDILVDFWLDLNKTGIVGHFTFMLSFVFPNTIELKDYCPLSVVEKMWKKALLTIKKNNYEKSVK